MAMARHRFTGKVAFITGAASGIGRATAVAFAAEGARVVIPDSTADALQETEAAVKIAGGEVLAIAVRRVEAEGGRGRGRTSRRNLRPHRLRVQQRRRGEQGRAASRDRP